VSLKLFPFPLKLKVIVILIVVLIIYLLRVNIYNLNFFGIMFWPSREDLGLVLNAILPLIQCVESYLGLFPRMMPYYQIEAPLLVPKDFDIVCVDSCPHSIHIRIDGELKLVYQPNHPHLSIKATRFRSNHDFEIVQGLNLVFQGKTPASKVAFGHIMIWSDLDGILTVKWWPQDTDLTKHHGWASIAVDEMEEISLSLKISV
jgi:hypothetical protein